MRLCLCVAFQEGQEGRQAAIRHLLQRGAAHRDASTCLKIPWPLTVHTAVCLRACLPADPNFALKRRWDDDVVFK